MNLKSNGPVDCVAYAPDGRKIATGAADGFGGKITIWDSRSGMEAGVDRVHSGQYEWIPLYCSGRNPYQPWPTSQYSHGQPANSQ